MGERGSEADKLWWQVTQGKIHTVPLACVTLVYFTLLYVWGFISFHFLSLVSCVDLFQLNTCLVPDIHKQKVSSELKNLIELNSESKEEEKKSIIFF